MIDTKTGTLGQLKPNEGDIIKCVESTHDWWTVGKYYTVQKSGVPLCDHGNDYSEFDNPQPSVIFQIISPYRASDWTNWLQSKLDGTYDTQPNREYETHDLPDTDQVMYRWREVAIKEPVVGWVDASVVTSETTNTYFQVKTIDGNPQWETVRYAPF